VLTPPREKGEVVAELRKVGPAAKLPAGAVLKSLSASDRRLLRRRVTEPVECMFDPSFLGWNGQVARPPKESDNAARGAQANDDSGLNLLGNVCSSDVRSDDEKHMFLWLNYCRYRVLRIIEQNSGQRLTAQSVAELLRWEHAAAQVREELVRSNVPLVLAMAKRARATRVDFADLVSEGNLALLRAVDKFDCRRGYKFSTYACRAILKSFSRVATRASRYRGRFPTEFDPTLEKSDHVERKRVDAEEDCLSELRSILGKNVAELSDVEQKVIRARFSLEGTSENGEPLQGKTLEQVGTMIGVTKERVRQIQNKALGKLRKVLEDGFLRP
jgi:RNA polymerase sigma factor (sigma-70 family)